MRKTIRVHKAQALLEYLLLTAVVALLVFMAFQPGGILEQTRDQAGVFFTKGAQDITGVAVQP